MENLIGQRFGSLVVEAFHERRNWNYYWHCKCDCGNKYIAFSGNLKRGTHRCHTCTVKARVKHGHSSGHNHGTKAGRSLTYSSWLSMFCRVSGKTEKLKYSYGHVSICKRWYDFVNFLDDMGKRPSKRHTLDRINNDGNYEPSNCRWATWKQQLANRRKRRNKRNY